MSTALTSYLPPFAGLLPKWLVLVAAISIGNSIQAYATLHYTKRVYSGTPPPTATSKSSAASSSSSPPSYVTPLSARTFGTWTFLTSLVRMYAAYHINEPAWYDIAMWTYGVAFAHFMSEWWIFGTAAWGSGLAGPVMVSTGSLGWMWMQRAFYLGV